MMTYSEMQAVARTIESDSFLMDIYLQLNPDFSMEDRLKFVLDNYIIKDKRYRQLYDTFKRGYR